MALFDGAAGRKKEAQDMYKRGFMLTARGMFAQALFFLDRALEADPAMVPAWHQKGCALGGLRHFGPAIRCLDAALALDCDFTPAWLFRGALLSETKQYEEAIACFDRVTEPGPLFATRYPDYNVKEHCVSRYIEALCSKAVALAGLKRFEEAEAQVRRAAVQDPDDPRPTRAGKIIRDVKSQDQAG
ncbi:MAG: tetratricopeptide repeat protein [Methanomicrobiaceae archaeon]|nr:tetratricopeptide repeat protein [Methanomicrobiaceae archaeon]